MKRAKPNARIGALLLCAALASPVVAQELALRIQAPAETIHAGEQVKFTVTISNTGKIPVTLIEPGDGSEEKMRTPLIGWSVIPAEEFRGKHPDERPRKRGGRCGNINPIRLKEIFTLAPGDTRALVDWVALQVFPVPGKYHLKFYYDNLPSLAITGAPMGEHEPGALEAMRQSSPCRLRSNELVVDVLEKRE